jgi:NitT/TauT family transport system substrate-binding protein
MAILRSICLLVAVALAAPVPVSSQDAALRVGITQSDCCVQALYAQDMGFFKKAGLNVDVRPFTSVSALAEGVAAGASDIGVTTLVQLAEAVSRGIPFRIIAAGGVVSRKSPGSALCVAAKSNIRTAQDLQGQTVAVIALKTTAEFALREWLTQNHADASKVKIVEMPFPQMGPSLGRGTVAAAVLSEPALSAALARGEVKAIAVPTDAVAPQYMVSVWFSTDRFIQTHADAVKKFVATIYGTARWANAHQDESGAILAKYAKIDPAVLKNMTRVIYRDSLQVSDIKPVLDLTYKYGAIDRPIAAADLLVQR